MDGSPGSAAYAWARAGMLNLPTAECDICGAPARLFHTGSGDRICLDSDSCIARLEAQGVPEWVP